MRVHDRIQPPEMVKRRHVVVVSPRYRRQTGLCLVVPFSTVLPHEIEPYHFETPPGGYAFFDAVKSTRATGVLTCFGFERLDRLFPYGRYAAPLLKTESPECTWRAN
jgi:uncharacterized protein YifN (PemK superfamily)